MKYLFLLFLKFYNFCNFLLLRISLPVKVGRVVQTGLCILPFFLIPSAHAQFANAGSGLYKNNIFWLKWGNSGDTINNGKTITSSYNLTSPATTANQVNITCTLNNLTLSSGTLTVYRPGTWSGDGLDNIYKVTASGGTTNTLDYAISHSAFAGSANFDVTCSATLGGQTFILGGLVFADAEQSSTLEFVGVTVPTATNVRVIDGFRSCTTRSTTFTKTTSGATSQYLMRNGSGQCAPEGPNLVAYLENTNTARFVVKGEGKSAIAVGVMVDFDFSEALPSSFGTASHSIIPAWTGGVAVPSTEFSNSSTWATRATPTIRLGPTVFADVNFAGAVGGTDVNGLNKKTVSSVSGFADVAIPVPNSTYTISSVNCSGGGKVAGWIDFNGNGSFDSSEKSNVATCAAGTGTVSLSWTVPPVGSGYKTQASTALRLRTAALETEITNPTGLANSGEVEDYFLALGTVQFQLKKQWAGGTVGDVANLSSTTGLVSSNTAAFTSSNTGSNSTTSNTIVVSPTEVVTLPTETFTPATASNRYVDASWVCSDGTNPSTTVAQGGNFTIPSSSVAKTISCTLTNTAITASGKKTANPASGENVKTGDIITYTLKVTVAGAALKEAVVLKDTMSSGLTFVASSLPSGCSISGQVMTCTLAAGTAVGDHTFVYKAKINESAGTVANPSVTNKVVLNNGTCTDCENIHPVTRTSVIASQKSSNPSPNTIVTVGKIINYTLTTKVSVKETENEVVLTDVIRQGLTFLNEVPAGCTFAANILTCKLPVGTAPGTYNFAFRAIVNELAANNPGGGGVTNLLEVNRGDCSPCLLDHDFSLSNDRSIITRKTATPPSGSNVKIGDSITYKLSVAITGDPLQQTMVLEDTLGEGLTLTGEAPTLCSFDDSNSLTCGLDVGTEPGDYEFIYTAIVNSKGATGGVTNKVTTDQGSCLGCETIHEATKVDTFKTVSGVNRENGTSVFIGDTLNFAVTVVVTGGPTAEAITLNDTLSAGLSLVTIPAGCEGQGQQLVCTLPKDSPVGQYVFSYSAVVTADASNVVSNKVVPSSGTCNSGCETFTKVTRKAVLRVTKTSDKKQFKIGDFVRYKILIENLEEVAANDFYIIDQPAPGLSFVKSSIRVNGDDSSSVGSSFPLIIKGLNLEGNSKLTIEYLMTINASAGRGQLCNQAKVGDDNQNVSSNVSKACVTRQADPDFEDTRIFGTVFEDSNSNGIQDAGEPGIPGVRLVTATGLNIETDFAGRYHIEGLDPGQLSRGRNYIVKLELNSFVDKIKLTTQNPLIKRITWGLPAQFNFGVKKIN